MYENVLVEKVHEQLALGKPLVLASIISLQGSTPRHIATKMIIGIDGACFGTIGGSLLEATAIKEARAVLSTGQSRFLDFELTGKGANSPGMICGGKATVLLDYVPATKENLDIFNVWAETIRKGDDFYFLTCVKQTGDKIDNITLGLILSDGHISGTCKLSEADINNIKTELHNVTFTAILPIKDTKVIIELIRKRKSLFCFGAGHVALPTAHIASLAGFQVIVIDDRVEFANIERFPDATSIRVIGDLNSALQGLSIDSDSFIIILTRGHQYDRAVLEQSLKTSAGYIGMISSRKKRDAIFEALIAKGFSREDLTRVHSPIGVDIDAETPEEIAVSIVAELISVRAGR